MFRRLFLIGAGLALAGCTTVRVDYAGEIPAEVSRSWTVTDVAVKVPDELTVSERNSYAPNAAIVWYGDPPGDRRAQVGKVLRDGIRAGTAGLNGGTPVILRAQLIEFHAVTPRALARAPGAVHNISFFAWIVDARSGERITQPTVINADLEALTGVSAVLAAQEGQTQKVRIEAHLAKVIQGWLSIGPDPRESYRGIGR